MKKQKPSALVQSARHRLSLAETALEEAKESSREAKRKRKEAKQAARLARKEVKRAKAELAEAKEAVEKAVAQTPKPVKKPSAEMRSTKSPPATEKEPLSRMVVTESSPAPRRKTKPAATAKARIQKGKVQAGEAPKETPASVPVLENLNTESTATFVGETANPEAPECTEVKLFSSVETKSSGNPSA